ncbi:MAG: M20 family metallopeptidase [Bryobacterales bacterium]|nr:M20 family metallopeptidase [Bryobacterales bacterium]
MSTSRVLSVLADLIRIKSINPAYDNGVSEAAMAAYVKKFFEPLGLETWEQEAYPGSPNLIVRLPGESRRKVILEAHMDTASINGMTIDPFDPVIKNGLMYGRGSCDTKAGLAGMMVAMAELAEQGIKPPHEVWLCAAADEEYSFRGVLKLCAELKKEADPAVAAIVAEPTELRLVIASKGVLRWKVNTRGRAAHSSKPHLGVNAIENMSRLVLALAEENRKLAEHKHPLLGPGTLNVGVIHGGVQVNFVPDWCTVEIDRRLLPGEDSAAVHEYYGRFFDSLGFNAWQEAPMLADEALNTAPGQAMVRCASQVLNGIGLDGEPVGVPYGSDASKLARIGVPSIIYGPGSIDQAHAAVEWVDCRQVEQATDFYRRFLVDFHE